jgi:hypothetical protein
VLPACGNLKHELNLLQLWRLAVDMLVRAYADALTWTLMKHMPQTSCILLALLAGTRNQVLLLATQASCMALLQAVPASFPQWICC